MITPSCRVGLRALEREISDIGLEGELGGKAVMKQLKGQTPQLFCQQIVLNTEASLLWYDHIPYQVKIIGIPVWTSPVYGIM